LQDNSPTLYTCKFNYIVAVASVRHARLRVKLPRSLAWASDRAELAGSSPAKKNRKCKNKNFACLKKNVFLSIYSLISGSGIKKIY